MSVQLPPSGTGTVLGTTTISGKDYPQCLISDGVTPANASVNAVGTGISTRVNELAVSSAPVDGNKVTYRAAVSALAVTAAATTDIFQIIGSATKTVKITGLRISGSIATTAVYVDYQLFKRSTAAAGGTAVNLTAVPSDSASAAATAVATTFTSTGPTVGTTVGQISAQRVCLPVTGTPVVNQPVVLIDSGRPAQAVTLRGVAQALCINCNTVTFATAPLFSIDVEWTEE
jgi:hypothetical protein